MFMCVLKVKKGKNLHIDTVSGCDLYFPLCIFSFSFFFPAVMSYISVITFTKIKTVV